MMSRPEAHWSLLLATHSNETSIDSCSLGIPIAHLHNVNISTNTSSKQYMSSQCQLQPQPAAWSENNIPLLTFKWCAKSSTDPITTMNSTDITSSGDSSEQLRIPMYMYILVSVSYGLILIIGLVGNIMVIYVVSTNASMRTSTNVFLVNLSIADICVLVVCVPTALTEFYAKDVWYLGETLCKYKYINLWKNKIK